MDLAIHEVLFIGIGSGVIGFSFGILVFVLAFTRRKKEVDK